MPSCILPFLCSYFGISMLYLSCYLSLAALLFFKLFWSFGLSLSILFCFFLFCLEVLVHALKEHNTFLFNLPTVHFSLSACDSFFLSLPCICDYAGFGDPPNLLYFAHCFCHYFDVSYVIFCIPNFPSSFLFLIFILF